jgi:hypothetical protein
MSYTEEAAPAAPAAVAPVTIATVSPIPGAKPDDPAINYAERREKALEAQAEEMIPAPVPTATPLEPMSDEDALAMAREIEARYLPPPLPPSIISQINAMREGSAEAPAPAPPPQPDPPTAS